MSDDPHTPNNWPIVALNDSGIRPAGRADRCFYCRADIGQPHGKECVVVEKVIRARYIIEVDVKVPHFWGKEIFEFHRNESSWCADNAIEEIEAHIQKERIHEIVSIGDCLCQRFTAEWVEVLDNTPMRNLDTPEQVEWHDELRRQRRKKR